MWRWPSRQVHSLAYFVVIFLTVCRADPGGDGEDPSEPDHETDIAYDDEMYEQRIPGVVQFDFKVEIEGGGQECFYQDIKEGSQLYAMFEVLRGADRNVDFIIRKPDSTVLEKHTWTNTGNTELKIQVPGEYTFCIDNSFSRFSRKLVYFFLASYIASEWQEYAEQGQQMEVSLSSIQETLGNVTYSIAQIRRAMGMNRMMSSKDQYIATTNNDIVQNLSMVMVVVFIVTSGVQVYFVKNMFRTVNVTPSQKPRA